MVERVHRKILRTIQGLPTRCPSSALNTLLGSDDIASRIKQCKLNFLNSVANLDDSALAKKLLLARVGDPQAKGLIPNLKQLLDESNLPDLAPLLTQHQTNPHTWKRFTKMQTAIKSYLGFLNDYEEYYVGDCDITLGRPLQHWGITLGNTTLTRANNLRIRLLAGCEGLEKDAARFHYRNTHLSTSPLPILRASSALLHVKTHGISSPLVLLCKVRECDSSRMLHQQSAPSCPTPSRDQRTSQT